MSMLLTTDVAKRTLACKRGTLLFPSKSMLQILEQTGADRPSRLEATEDTLNGVLETGRLLGGFYLGIYTGITQRSKREAERKE
jgi:hypothetical protein